MIQEYYVVTVTYFKPLDVFVGGVFYDEAVIHKRLAIAKGYKDAAIWHIEDFRKAKAARQRGPRMEDEPSTRDRVLHDLRAQSDTAALRQAARE